MFRDAFSFNQDLSQWDVSNVQRMAFMFTNASSFNNSLGEWDLTSLDQTGSGGFPGGLVHMLSYSGMNPFTYQATLDGWANSSSIPQGITLDSEDLFYCSEDSRTILMQNGWTIGGDEITDDASLCASSDSENIFISNLNISPNPCTEYISFNNLYPDLEYAQVLNFNGNIINHYKAKLGNNKLNLEHLPEGFYVLQLIFNNKIESVKFLKM